VQDPLPDLFRRLGEPQELAILLVDHPLLGEEADVDGPPPVRLADEHDRNGLDLAGLHQGQGLEQLVEGAEAARKDDQRPGPQQEVQLAQGEVVEAEAEVRRDVGIGILLVGQVDVEADGLGSHVVRSAVGGLHDPRPAAGRDDDAGILRARSGAAHQPTELASHVVVAALGEDPLGSRQPPGDRRVVAGPRSGAQLLDGSARGRRLADSRAAEDHDRMVDPVLLEQPLGLEVVQLQPNAARVVAAEEVDVEVGLAVARALEDRPHASRGIGILFRRLGALPRQGLTPPLGVRRAGNARHAAGLRCVVVHRSSADRGSVRPGPRGAGSCTTPDDRGSENEASRPVRMVPASPSP
jgi:hypothetical protein